MMVTYDTAKRLRSAGFDQPNPADGQQWYDRYENISVLSLLHGPPETIPEIAVLSLGDCDTYSIFDMDSFVFAPTATDILMELPEYAVARHIDYRGQSGEAWFCWDTLDRAKTFSHPTNPAEAAAQAWLSINEKNSQK